MELLINCTPLFVLPDLAKKLDLKEAIILQQLDIQLQNASVKFEGDTWYRCTYEGWAKQFPFWSVKTIRRTFSRLEKRHFIISTNRFNTTKWDHRKWYRINYDLLYDELGLQNGSILDAD
ncbi:MAG TPA: hypothetical protein VNU45_10450 [Rummeliibacillus sp.]|nr:hypothetical protein [Rummeliibacillus sp.]